jgi:undecaprenyl diphosphate synthase
MRHIAFIADGNGRWATDRGKDRLQGHEEGCGAVLRAIAAADELRIPYVTFYGFSTENFSRSPREVMGIFGVIADFLENRLLPLARSKGYRVRFIGELRRLPADLLGIVSKVNAAVLNNRGMTVTVALAYGGREEAAAAVNALIENRRMRDLDVPVTYADLQQFLYTAGTPDPDLVVRYGGFCRLSNFLPLQTVYSEWMFTDKLWPDLEEDDIKIFAERYTTVQRKFGSV